MSTGRVTLNSSKNDFERAAVDTFSFPGLVNVGKMTRILIGHDNAGAGAAWHLNKVGGGPTRPCITHTCHV